MYIWPGMTSCSFILVSKVQLSNTFVVLLAQLCMYLSVMAGVREPNIAIKD